jgi:predicted nucleotidyltransferase
MVIAGLKHVVEQRRRHGVTHIWIDGSFATDKQRPNDADVVYAVPPGGDDEDWADVGRGLIRLEVEGGNDDQE